MARVNITLPDELVEAARAGGLNVSRCAAQGVTEELDRLTRRAALQEYLREQDAPTAHALAAAERWADGAGLPDAPPDTSSAVA